MATMTYNDQIQRAIEVTESSEYIDRVELSTGVILRLKKFSVLRLQAVVEKFEYPPVPKVMDENKGRMMENPYSEAYTKQVAEVDRKRGLAVIDVILAAGTEPLYIPEGFQKPEDDGWIDELVTIGISVNDGSKTARYLAWAKFVAIVDENDLSKVTSIVGNLIGSGEQAVAKQLHDNFPNQ